MMNALALLLLLQQPIHGQFSTPSSGDTVGYWQQRVAYHVTATLDEEAERLRARGHLWYVNNSPDALDVLYLHQHLNAFRPGSAWSASDEREGRNEPRSH
mgnify:CR=1 FL=1